MITPTLLRRTKDQTISNLGRNMNITGVNATNNARATLSLNNLINSSITMRIKRRGRLRTTTSNLIRRINNRSISMPILNNSIKMFFNSLVTGTKRATINLLRSINLNSGDRIILTIVLNMLGNNANSTTNTNVNNRLGIRTRLTKSLRAPTTRRVFTLTILPVRRPISILLKRISKTCIDMRIRLPTRNSVNTLRTTTIKNNNKTLRSSVTNLRYHRYIVKGNLTRLRTLFSNRTLSKASLRLTNNRVINRRVIRRPLNLFNSSKTSTITTTNTSSRLVRLNMIFYLKTNLRTILPLRLLNGRHTRLLRNIVSVLLRELTPFLFTRNLNMNRRTSNLRSNLLPINRINTRNSFITNYLIFRSSFATIRANMSTNRL